MIRCIAPRLLVTSLFLLLSHATLGEGFQTPAIKAADLQTRQATADPLLVVDVRPTGEYKSGHIAGAVSIPYTKVDQHLDEFRTAKGVVLYCTQGYRTQEAERILLDHQVPNILHLEGGLGAWQMAGYPINTGWGP